MPTPRITLDDAMLRADSAANALGLEGGSRVEMLVILAPEMADWLDLDEPSRRLVGVARLVKRAEKAFRRLRLNLDDLARILDVLAPELVRDAGPAPPTEAWPGSEAKIRTLMDREAHAQELFHAADAKLPERVGHLGIGDGPNRIRGQLVATEETPAPQSLPRWSPQWWFEFDDAPNEVTPYRVLPDQPKRTRVARSGKKSRKPQWPVKRGQLWLFDPGERRPRVVRAVVAGGVVSARSWVQLVLWPDAEQAMAS